jgi:hypothetical protein
LAQQTVSKELDLTEMYYFGARYYDPKISLWISPDPILGKYLDDVGKAKQNNDKNSVFTAENGGMDGALNSKNLALYSYASQNPVIMFDPDGEVAVGYQVRQNDQSFLVIVENHDGKIKTYSYNLTENAPLYSPKTGEKYGSGAKLPPKQFEWKGREKGNTAKLPSGYPLYTTEGAGPDSFETDNGTIRTDTGIHAGNNSEACPLLGPKSNLTDKQKAEIQGIYDRNKNDGGTTINLYEYPGKENKNNETGK